MYAKIKTNLVLTNNNHIQDKISNKKVIQKIDSAVNEVKRVLFPKMNIKSNNNDNKKPFTYPKLNKYLKQQDSSFTENVYFLFI